MPHHDNRNTFAFTSYVKTYLMLRKHKQPKSRECEVLFLFYISIAFEQHHRFGVTYSSDTKVTRLEGRGKKKERKRLIGSIM